MKVEHCCRMSAIIPRVSQLSPLVTRVLGCNPGHMTLQGTNTYLVGVGKSRLLVDTGERGVGEYIDNLQGTLRDQEAGIGKILLTHWHHDHVGGVRDVLAGRATRDIVLYKFPRTETRSSVWGSVPGGEANVGEASLEGVDVVELSDGEVVEVEGARLRVVHTPGHTTDHVVLHLEEEGSVFSGDCILGEGTAVFEDLFDYMQSLDKILQLQPTRIYPGHGPVIEDPLPKIRQYIQHRNLREGQILDCLKSSSCPLSSMEIVKNVYRETPEKLHRAAEINVQNHLTKLYRENKVDILKEHKKWSFIQD